MRDRSGTNESLRKTIHSVYSIDPEAGGVASTLGVLVILKIIFVDILITGFGGAITDLLQVLEVCAEPYICIQSGRLHDHRRATEQRG